MEARNPVTMSSENTSVRPLAIAAVGKLRENIALDSGTQTCHLNPRITPSQVLLKALGKVAKHRLEPTI